MPDSSYKQLILSILCYALILSSLYTICTFLEFIHFWPQKDNVILWDASWYADIKAHGFYYSDKAQSNSGFFPLFSYMWRFIHVNNIGICIVNFILFGISSIYICKELNITSDRMLLFISFPSSVFFMVPYTESLFFLCSCVFLIGLIKQNNYLIILGLLFASMTRATAVFFIPSLFVMEFFFYKTLFSKKLISKFFISSAICVLGIAVVVYIHYFQTGVYFAYAKSQVQFWGHKFHVPGFPLVAWDNARVMWLDCMALIAGISALCILFFLSCQLIKRSEKWSALFANKVYIFSLMYCVVVTIYLLCFNEKDADGHTGLNGLNRYLFATPFFLVFLHYTFNSFTMKAKNIMIFSAITLLVFFLTGITSEFAWLNNFFNSKYNTLIFFFFIYIYMLIVFSLSKDHPFKREVNTVIVILNIILQISLINTFIQQKWVG